jgi:hypothetical protein
MIDPQIKNPLILYISLRTAILLSHKFEEEKIQINLQLTFFVVCTETRASV